MPTISASTPRVTHEFQTIPIAVPYVFAEGHTLTDLEARGLNRFVATALGNAFGSEIRRALKMVDADRAKAVKAKTYTGPMIEDAKGRSIPAPTTVDDLPPADHQAIFDAKFSSYALGVGRQSTPATSSAPLDRVVANLAKEAIKAKILARGWQVRSFMLRKGNYTGVDAEGRRVWTDDDTSKTSYFAARVEAYINDNEETLTAQAQAQLDAIASVQDDFDLDLPSAAA